MPDMVQCARMQVPAEIIIRRQKKCEHDAHFRTSASLSRTRRTKARVRLSRESSGLLAPPGEAPTRPSVPPVVKFLEKMA